MANVCSCTAERVLRGTFGPMKDSNGMMGKLNCVNLCNLSNQGE
jgi:hypothetical protein